MLIKLTDLDAEFIRRTDRPNICEHVPTLAEAEGVDYVCPECYRQKGSTVVGAHHVRSWFRGKVPDDLEPKPGRWTPAGTGLNDLSFVPGNPPIACSVLLQGGCNGHWMMENGYARLC